MVVGFAAVLDSSVGPEGQDSFVVVEGNHLAVVVVEDILLVVAEGDMVFYHPFYSLLGLGFEGLCWGHS